MYKVIFRIGNEQHYIWKEVNGVFLKDHAEELCRNLMQRHVFNLLIPAEDFTQNGLPKTFELKSVEA